MVGDVFVLDGWLVDVSSGEISRDGETVRLEPQVVKVLTYLAERPNAVVTRRELFDNLWDHAFVGDAALTRCIFEIRQALRDDPKSPSIIETIPRVGFRLLATPSGVPGPATVHRRLAALAAGAFLVICALAVGPLVSSDSTAQVSQPTVQSYEFYEAAQRHHSNVSRVSNRSAIAMFERSIESHPDFGPAHAGLAEALSRQIMYWGGDRIEDALAAAETAEQLLPDHARSHNALGLAYHVTGDDDKALESFALARQLDSNYIEPIFNAAELHRRRLDFAEARELFLAVVESDPGNSIAMAHLGYINLRMGEVDVANAWIRQAINDEPFAQYANTQLATLEMVRGNYAKAVEVCEIYYELYPTSRACLNVLGAGNLMLGRYSEAMQWFNVIEQSFEHADYALLGQAQVMLAQNRSDVGLALINDVLHRSMAAADSPDAGWNTYWTIAASLSLKGEFDEAFVWLDKAADAGRQFYLWDATDTVFMPLHGDRRFDRYIATTRTEANRSF